MNIDNVKMIPTSLEASTLLCLVDTTKEGLVKGSPHHQYSLTFFELDFLNPFSLQLIWLEVIEEVEPFDIY